VRPLERALAFALPSSFHFFLPPCGRPGRPAPHRPPGLGPSARPGSRPGGGAGRRRGGRLCVCVGKEGGRGKRVFDVRATFCAWAKRLSPAMHPADYAFLTHLSQRCRPVGAAAAAGVRRRRGHAPRRGGALTPPPAPPAWPAAPAAPGGRLPGGRPPPWRPSRPASPRRVGGRPLLRVISWGVVRGARTIWFFYANSESIRAPPPQPPTLGAPRPLSKNSCVGARAPTPRSTSPVPATEGGAGPAHIDTHTAPQLFRRFGREGREGGEV